jgi:hypothetical protein
MTQVIVLRRVLQTERLFHGHLGPVQLDIESDPSAVRGVDAFSINADADRNMMRYGISLPEGYRVRPGDWRALIHDADAIGALIDMVVSDNSDVVLFEPWSSALGQQVSDRLRIALADLSRIVDVLDVSRTASAALEPSACRSLAETQVGEALRAAIPTQLLLSIATTRCY